MDSRGWQPLLDHALRAWIEDGDEDGWHRFSTGAAAALDELVTGLGPGRDAVVVTSGGVLAALCAGLLSMPAEGVVALNRVAVNAAITTVTAGGSGAHLLSFNDHAHFTGERRALLTYR
ncbi:broad specificity phosphatase PhoE [Thermobifida halotolerans]|uniref:histidine phosphatase family protein n=1 Tax=Thermobifida halotolerans TaxID=483545 RepID=UPI0035995B03